MQRKYLLISAFLLLPATVLVLVSVSYFFSTPGNVWVIALGYLVGGAAILYFLLPIGLFCLLSAPLFRGRVRLPIWALVFFLLAVAAVVAYFVSSWHFGIQYQGAWVCTSLAYLNGGMVLVLGALAARNWVIPAARTSFFFNWLLVLWLSTFAFPYLGEVL